MFKEFVYVTQCVALRQFFFSVSSLLTVNTSFALSFYLKFKYRL